ncbi:LuxR C-terminal-related transcriptional regulator [Rhodococcus sp. NPDC127530]|uniref:LuxR C-terminal-related transcriptional regulator n=1 Tax=unclassified Rhodococcus (in: high G+C Gram-positive bacteria) TaxID=192944 RepID=UPI00362B31A2
MTISRVQSRSGIWVVLHGRCLTSTGARRIAIIVEPAEPGRIYPLLMSAYGLTEREKEVTRLVLHDASTSQMAAELVVSAHTVQQHLMSIFEDRRPQQARSGRESLLLALRAPVPGQRTPRTRR